MILFDAIKQLHETALALPEIIREAREYARESWERDGELRKIREKIRATKECRDCTSKAGERKP